MSAPAEIAPDVVKCSFSGTIITYKRLRKSHVQIKYKTVPKGLDEIAGKDIQKIILGELKRQRPLKTGRYKVIGSIIAKKHMYVTKIQNLIKVLKLHLTNL